MPINFWTVLAGLTMVSAAVSTVAVCGCLVYGNREDRKKLALPILIAIIVLAVCLGGNALLARYGLSWRKWLVSLAALAVLVLAFMTLARMERTADRLLQGHDAAQIAVFLCGVVTGLALIAGGVLVGGINSWGDWVTEWEGQKVVEEYVGIFHVKGYRYINWLVHGEQVYEWQD